jgi:glycosyltransferase involved in cell wall biosynthesis
MRILAWHVHGSWMTAFVQGRHEYLVPVLPDRGPDGRGRARTWDWPSSVCELPPERLRDTNFDVVLLQRPHEIDLVREWTGRVPGRDVPAVYVEHDAPEPHPTSSRHVLADRGDITLVHVTHFNATYWDNGRAPTAVIEHGIPDPGMHYSGELPHAAVVSNEPYRRARIVGTDLVDELARSVPVDHFGNADGPPSPGVHLMGELRQSTMHVELGRRRVYFHPYRWTSLGLALLEAMQVGLPVVALAATAAIDAVPPAAGVLSTDPRRLRDAVQDFVREPDAARAAGMAARNYALDRFGLDRFSRDWDQLLKEVTA